MNLLASLLAMAIYSTTFPLTENPVSEGGMWKQNNVNRAQLLTTGGHAFGNGANNDGYAYLLGFGDSIIETLVFRDPALSDTEPNSYEIEHLHRVSDDSGNTVAYEVDSSYAGGTPIVVRWSGATNFVVLSGLSTDANFFPDGAGGQWRSGYKVKTEIPATKDRINIYADSGSGYVLYNHYIYGADATNDAVPIASGDPGLGAFTTIGSSNLFGFDDATITSPALLTGRAIGSNAFHPGRSPGLGGISSARFQPSNGWPYSPPAVVAFDGALMSAMEKHGNDPLILPPQVVASGMTPPEEMPT